MMWSAHMCMRECVYACVVLCCLLKSSAGCQVVRCVRVLGRATNSQTHTCVRVLERAVFHQLLQQNRSRAEIKHPYSVDAV